MLVVERSVDELHVEALRNLYLDDPIVQDIVGDHVYLGPASEDPDTEKNHIIRPRQINVMLAPDFGFEVEVGGVGNQFVPLVTAYYDHPNDAPYTPGAPNNPISVLIHLQKLQAQGSGEGTPIQFNNQGKLINPDAPTSTDPVQRYLNVLSPDFRTLRMGTRLPKNVARLFAFLSIYVTEVDYFTRKRI